MQADHLWLPPNSDYNLHKNWLKVSSYYGIPNLTTNPLLIPLLMTIMIMIMMNMIICMQSNFEKLTREELVIVEAENVLQPAAIQKVFDHKSLKRLLITNIIEILERITMFSDAHSV